MKQISFLLFIGSFILIYFFAHYYVWIRIRQSGLFSEKGIWIFSFFYFILFVSFIISRFTIHSDLFLHEIIVWISSYWIVIALYLFIFILCIDIVRVFNYFFHFIPDKIFTIPFNKIIFVSIAVVLIVLIGYGTYNARNTKIVTYNIFTNKNLGNRDTLTIVGISDIHLGSLVGKKRLEQLSTIVYDLQPEIILIAGDILDEIHGPIFRNDIGSPLRKLNSKYGIFAIPGNHEYIGDIFKSEKYISSLGFTYLKDSVVHLDEINISIIGRDDRQVSRFTSHFRKSIDLLIKEVSSSRFVILLDHQPFDLHHIAKYNIDFQFSGHTHKGQFWPFNWIVKQIYELAHGYLKINNTHFIVSSGFGTWGPPVRIGSCSEIVVVKIRKQSNQPL